VGAVVDEVDTHLAGRDPGRHVEANLGGAAQPGVPGQRRGRVEQPRGAGALGDGLALALGDVVGERRRCVLAGALGERSVGARVERRRPGPQWPAVAGDPLVRAYLDVDPGLAKDPVVDAVELA